MTKNLKDLFLTFQTKYDLHQMSMFIVWEKSVPKPKDELVKVKLTYNLHTMRCCWWNLILIICLFFSYSLHPDLKDKASLENLQWSIDPGADLSQYKMDITVIDTKVNLYNMFCMFCDIEKSL